MAHNGKTKNSSAKQPKVVQKLEKRVSKLSKQRKKVKALAAEIDALRNYMRTTAETGDTMAVKAAVADDLQSNRSGRRRPAGTKRSRR